MKLTKEEAIKQMELGKKVTHKYFSPNEWITMSSDDRDIVTEEGYTVDKIEFWSYRTADSFNSGWSIVE